MKHNIDPRNNSLIDANLFRSITGPDAVAVSEIFALEDAEEVLLQIPHSVKAEIDHPNTSPAAKQQATMFIYTCPVSSATEERDRHDRVRALVRGNAKAGKHDPDAYHMVDAAKYGGYFITGDERLMKKRLEVQAMLGEHFPIVTPAEFREAYRQFADRHRR